MSIKEAYEHAPNWLQIASWVIFGTVVFTAIFGTVLAFLILNFADPGAWFMGYVLTGILGIGVMWMKRDTAPSGGNDWF